jgi:acyl carrier protein
MPVEATSEEAARTTSQATVELSAVEWLRTELEDPEITGADNFLDIGGHSLTFSKLNKFLDDSFGVVLDMKTTYDESLGHAVAKRQRGTGPAPRAGEQRETTR